MMQQLKELTLESLAELDGKRLALAFQEHMKRVAADCYDRPAEDKARAVIIKIAVKPILSADGVCDDVDVQFEVSDTVPKRRTRIYNMALKKAGLLFRPDSLDEVDQQTLDFDDSGD